MTDSALIPVNFKMGAAQKEIDKGKNNGANSTENYHCRYCCDCRLTMNTTMDPNGSLMLVTMISVSGFDIRIFS